MNGRFDRAERARPRWVAWVVWLVVLVATALLLLSIRDRVDKAHVALAFLIVVLGGSGAAGRALGLTLAGLAFLAFNFFFLPPYSTLVIANQLDWLVLAAFLIASIVAAQLLTRAQERAEVARQRAVEVERLATLGAETLNAGRAEDALARIVEVIRAALRVDRCEIIVRGEPPWVTMATNAEPEALVVAAWAATGESMVQGRRESSRAADGLAGWVLAHGGPAAQFADGTTWVGGTEDMSTAGWEHFGSAAEVILAPLRVRERTVGVLRIAGAPIRLDAAQRQFLSALSYYAALGVDRARLVIEAERAEAFRQADALKAALIAGVSHDLRTPLTTIKALANRLRERGAAEAAIIEDEADRLNRLVADLLDLSRLNTGAMPMRVELNTIDDLIGAALQRIGPALGDRRVNVIAVGTGDQRAAGDDGGPALVGRFDFVQSLRALVNLIENAAKYSPSAEPIELTASRVEDAVEVRVADRGRGVADAERQRIFEPFYRGPGAPSNVGGAGLGLAIARRLAEEQGGGVRYEPRQGGGSVFVLTLPAADDLSLDPSAVAPAPHLSG